MCFFREKCMWGALGQVGLGCTGTLSQCTPRHTSYGLVLKLAGIKNIMVRNRKRKTEKQGQTDPDVMKAAVEMVLGGTSLRKAAEVFQLSKSCLQRYTQKAKNAISAGQ